MTRDICTDNNIFFEVYPTRGLMRNEVSDIILKRAHTSAFIGEKNIYQSICLCPLRLFRKCLDTAKINEPEEKNIFREII